MTEIPASSRHAGWGKRWLYVTALPAVLLNYAAMAVGALLLDNEPRASLLETSLNFLFIFPFALAAFLLMVAVRVQTPAQDLPRWLTGGMGTVLITLALATLTYVPTGVDVHGKLGPASSLASRVLNLDVAASALISSLMQWGFAVSVIYLVGACALRLRAMRGA